MTLAANHIQAFGERLAVIAGMAPPGVYDVRIDSADCTEDVSLLTHAKHQALMRTYQARYVLLPESAIQESITQRLARHYDTAHVAAMSGLRCELENELIAPLLHNAEAPESLEDFITRCLPGIDSPEEDAFVDFLTATSSRSHHYQNFLIQSSSDLLAEASASAIGLIGEFGPTQSALFRILIDEFGGGDPALKHSMLFRHVMRDFGLSQEYNAYWPWFDTPTLALHNAIHFLFQNPRHIFGQIGFLLYAEASYRVSTQAHCRYLARFHPEVDARYFSEHAEVDLSHSKLMVDEVARPLVSRYGADAGHEIRRGAEMIRRLFAAGGTHLVGVSECFEKAHASGEALYGPPVPQASRGIAVTPRSVLRFDDDEWIQVGGIGRTTALAFSRFPDGSIGRRTGSDA